MPLILKLGPAEKLFVNGAVITNSDRRSSLHVENNAQVLREKDILLEEDVQTPVRSAYFAAQNVMLNTRTEVGSISAFLEQLNLLRGVFIKAEHRAILDESERLVRGGNVYKALALLRDLVIYESALLNMDPPDRFRRRPA